VAFLSQAGPVCAQPDHGEFDAMPETPFAASDSTVRTSIMHFMRPGAASGVPGGRGEVTPLQGVTGSETTFTPSPGEHCYYIRLVQDDGRMLWSAPVWVRQHE